MKHLLTIFLLVQFAVADEVLVQYGFDSTLPTAKEGFYIFENARGYVEPTNEERFSGYRSLEIQEASLDTEFAELQGVLAPVSSGELLFHFAMLIRNPEEQLNIALAGPQHFFMKKDGIAFWLKSIDGTLFHHGNGIPKRLFKLQPNRWYVFDVALHVDEGTYDLRVKDGRSGATLAYVPNEWNATHSPGSKISKLSFIGDLEDRSSVRYFVDDVELRALSSRIDLSDGSDPTTRERAPAKVAQKSSLPEYIEKSVPSSRKKGYFDELLELEQLTQERAACLPATSLKDFSITKAVLAGDNSAKNELRSVLDASEADLRSIPQPQSPVAASILLWRRGCQLLAAGSASNAKQQLLEARRLNPDAAIVLASLVTVENTLKNQQGAQTYLLPLYSAWAKDARLPALLASSAARWKNFGEAADALQGVADQMASNEQLIGTYLTGDHQGLDSLRRAFGSEWKNELDDLFIGQNYFFALLLSGRAEEALSFSQQFEDRYRSAPDAQDAWRERRVMALVRLGRTAEAEALLHQILQNCTSCGRPQRMLEELEGMR